MASDAISQVEDLKFYLSNNESQYFEKNSQTLENKFEKLLPYAIGLGVSNQWAAKLEGELTSLPNWYSNELESLFSRADLVGSLNQIYSFIMWLSLNKSSAVSGIRK